MNNLIEKLIAYKKSNNESYESIARELGVSTSAVYKWMNNYDKKIRNIYMNQIKSYAKKKGFLHDTTTTNKPS